MVLIRDQKDKPWRTVTSAISKLTEWPDVGSLIANKWLIAEASKYQHAFTKIP